MCMYNRTSVVDHARRETTTHAGSRRRSAQTNKAHRWKIHFCVRPPQANENTIFFYGNGDRTPEKKPSRENNTPPIL